MNAVWKFPLKLLFSQEVEMPVGARPLCVQVQHGTPCIWAQVDPSTSGRTSRRVTLAPTGYQFEQAPPGDYLGTVQMGELVFHVYVWP